VWLKNLFVWKEQLLVSLLALLYSVRLSQHIEDAWCCPDIDGTMYNVSSRKVLSFIWAEGF
jgi:hypothetical protein